MLSIILQALYFVLSQIPLLLLLFVLFVLLNVLDAHSTWNVLKPDHYNRERNPVARWVFRKLGIPRGIIIFKVVLLLILAIAFAFVASSATFTLNIILIIADLIFLLVVIHNYRICKRLGIRTPFDKR